MSQLIFENDHVRCELEQERSLLRHTWLKKPTSELFRSNLLQVLEHYNQLKGDFENLKWLADTVKLGELSHDDEVWLEDIWDPLLFQEGGVKAHAVVLGSDIFADYPMEMFKLSAVQKNSELGVELEVFSSLDKAYEWLEER